VYLGRLSKHERERFERTSAKRDQARKGQGSSRHLCLAGGLDAALHWGLRGVHSATRFLQAVMSEDLGGNGTMPIRGAGMCRRPSGSHWA
jgi:hypothetical protein